MGTIPAVEWQPIATAPKDGEDILLAREGHEVGMGYWFPSDGTEWEWQFTSTPTHWSPMPEPPR
jgi:hypothetical protein